MLSKYIPYTKIYLGAFLLLAIGLSTGKFLMSVASIILACAWVFEGGFKSKWEKIKSFYYAPLILSLGYLIHIVWLLNTTNFQYAFHDIVLKLPLLSFPIVLGSIPSLSIKNYRLIISIFIGGLFVSTLISYGVYLEILPTKRDILDVRNISIFVSHIRLSLLICLAIFLMYYYFYSLKKVRLILVALSIWFTYFLFLLSGTGIIVLCVLISYSLFWLIGKHSLRKTKIIAGLTSLLFLLFSTGYIYNSYSEYSEIKDKSDFSNLDERTQEGSKYIHDTVQLVTENGYYIWLYVAPQEVKDAWEERSSVPFTYSDKKGQSTASTIYRYITSKGYRKDRQGVLKLSDKEVKEIENGATSCVQRSSVNKRLHQIFFEIDSKIKGIDANGHSVTQRFNFMYTGMMIFRDNVFFGVGTGDVPDSFEQKYNELNSKLKKENRKRAHNQFLTLLISFGVIGFVIWLFSFVYPMLLVSKDKFIYGAFLVIAIISFFGDDTLETQAGVTFFAFFNGLFLFHSLSKK